MNDSGDVSCRSVVNNERFSIRPYDTLVMTMNVSASMNRNKYDSLMHLMFTSTEIKTPKHTFIRACFTKSLLIIPNYSTPPIKTPASN